MTKRREDTHVAVLMGGLSAEREVSLSSGKECSAALREAGYQVTEVDVDRKVAQTLTELGPDVCFNALHGPGGEDGSIQGLLNFLDIPYTHSGVLASALAMDKPRAKQLFGTVGIRCPEGWVLTKEQVAAGETPPAPYVLKPLNQGSSFGVQIVASGENRVHINGNWPFGDEVLVERYVPGRELTVGVVGDRALTVTEIRPKDGFYDYAAKYTDGIAVHDVPAEVPVQVREEAMRSAVAAHRALGCRGVSRADFRYDDTGEGCRGRNAGILYMLEVNTQPGMTPLSLLPEQAAHCGISFPELVSWMVEQAQCDS